MTSNVAGTMLTTERPWILLTAAALINPRCLTVGYLDMGTTGSGSRRKKSKPADKSESEITIVGCVRRNDPYRLVLPGSEIEQCAICGEEIWVAPSSPKQHPHWCLECVFNQHKKDKMKFTRTPKAEVEIAEALIAEAKRRGKL